MTDKNEQSKLYEFMYQTPVSQLTPDDLSKVITAYSNILVGWIGDGGHDFDEENVRQGINNLFRYKAASYPDEPCMHILDMIIEEGRKVPDDEYGNQTRRIEVRHLNKCLGLEGTPDLP